MTKGTPTTEQFQHFVRKVTALQIGPAISEADRKGKPFHTVSYSSRTNFTALSDGAN